MDDEPRPEDYPDQINAYVRARRQWEAQQPRPPLEPPPADLEFLFTPESLEAARRDRGLGNGYTVAFVGAGLEAGAAGEEGRAR